ncbi:MAG: molybdopterin oxidoreductase family protein [Rhodocyclaceae bacterium]|nr:molybdopterin oxidoreductase family protein [Rhodocyclaceae bacterium]MBK9625110.1 molybdopterin oxidoreductase family protein [Rhodocyclaceae bacterium]MBP6110610.1 molybdopterin oxidoreductase family protein [Rhodocyclaceae bacterium]
MSSALAASNTRVAHRICPLCEACCGLELTIEHEKVISVRGHDADVFSAGYICPKGVAIKNLHDDPDRLRTPLIKRDGKFVAATWDEAFEEIDRRLPAVIAAGGGDSVAMTLGNPAAHKIGLLLYGGRIAKALKTRNVYSASTLDQMPKQLSAGLMFGAWLSIPVPDIERCDLLIVLGANPVASNGSLWTVPDFRGKAKALKARGGRMVVIDPRRTETAELADAHHFIRPAGDVFLLLGMVHTLYEERLVTLGHVSEHLAGLSELEAAINIPQFSAESVSERCGIAAATIRQLARDMAVTPRAALYSRIGTCTQEFGTLGSWLVDVINTLTGHLDSAGGVMFSKSAAFAANTQGGKPGSAGVGKGITTGRHASRVSGAPEVYGELPIGCLAEEIQTPGAGQVRGLITVASNPVLSAPNGPRLAEAFEQLDFMVSVDIYLNETTRHADVILPGRSPLEDAHYDVAFPQFSFRNHSRYSAPVFAPTPGQPAEWEILLRLEAIIAGRGAKVDLEAFEDERFAADLERQIGSNADAVQLVLAGRRGPDRLIDLALRGGPYGDKFGRNPDGISLTKVQAAADGIDLGELKPRIPEMLRTPSGKVELAPPVLIADVARAANALAEPAPDLVIIGRRQIRSNNSWMHNLPILSKGPFRCTALVHPADAAKRGIVDGGQARISANSRSIEVQVEISDEMMPGVVSLPHGWGHDLPGTGQRIASQRPGANLNALFDENWRDPLSGNSVLSGVPIEMTAISL